MYAASCIVHLLWVSPPLIFILFFIVERLDVKSSYASINASVYYSNDLLFSEVLVFNEEVRQWHNETMQCKMFVCEI